MVNMWHSILISLLSIVCVLTAPPKKFGPLPGDEYLHGVLMHGDTEVGDSHKNEDLWNKMAEDDKLRVKDPSEIGPKDAMDAMHGVLMHGDTEAGVNHMHQQQDIGPKEVKKIGPQDAEEYMHGVLMHGDEKGGHDHSRQHKAEKKKAEALVEELESQEAGPKDIMEEMHGVLMHGDNAVGHDHEADHKKRAEEEKERAKVKGTIGVDLEGLMHGDEGGHVHEKPRDPMGARSGKPKGIPSIADPHEAIHGDLNAQIKLGEAPAAEQDEFKKWKDGDEDSNGLLGFTFPFITDSLINEIDVMKKRWLSKFWGDEEDSVAFDEEDHSRDKKLDAEEIGPKASVNSKHLPRSTDVERRPNDFEAMQKEGARKFRIPAANRRSTPPKPKHRKHDER